MAAKHQVRRASHIPKYHKQVHHLHQRGVHRVMTVSPAGRPRVYTVIGDGSTA